MYWFVSSERMVRTISESIAYILPKNENYSPQINEQNIISNFFKSRNILNLAIYYIYNDTIRFYDCGENFENILCPFCGYEIETGWWQEEMCKASETGFNMLKINTPCCNKESSLNEIEYNFPQGFALYAIKIEDFDMDKFPINETLLSGLENITGMKWKIVFSHY